MLRVLGLFLRPSWASSPNLTRPFRFFSFAMKRIAIQSSQVTRLQQAYGFMLPAAGVSVNPETSIDPCRAFGEGWDD